MKAKITNALLRSLIKEAINPDDVFLPINTFPLRVHDTEQKGFGCRIAKNGLVSWMLQKSLGGRTGRDIHPVIGRYPDMSLEAARKQATIDLGLIAQGHDVSLRRKQRLEAEKQIANAVTFAEIFNVYLDQKISEAGEATPSRYWHETRRLFNTIVVPMIGERTLLVRVAKPDIRALISKLSDRPSAQRHVYAFLSPFFKWATQNDYIPISPMADIKRPPAARERDRVLSDNELLLIWRACEKIGFPYGHCVKLLLLLGQRQGEVSGMLWPELDLVSHQWHIPASRNKTKNYHIVHLSPLALSIIQSIPRGKSDHVFHTRKSKNPTLQGFFRAKCMFDLLMSNEAMPIEEVRGIIEQLKSDYEHRITCTPWRFHDLRRTMATNLAMLKHPPFIVDKILNHVIPSKVSRVYNRFEYLDERRVALNDWSHYVTTLVSPSPKESKMPTLSLKLLVSRLRIKKVFRETFIFDRQYHIVVDTTLAKGLTEGCAIR